MKTTAPTHSSIHASTSACIINEEGSAEKNDVQKNLQAVKNMALEIPSTICTHNTKNQRVIKEPISFKSGRLIVQETDVHVRASRQAQFIQHAGEIFRVKNPIHGNYHAAEEVVMGSLFSMTGLDAPQLLLCNHCDDFFVFNQETREDFSKEKDLSRFACVASKFEPSFSDLGTFLLDTKTMVDLISRSEISMQASNQHVERTVLQYLQQVRCFHDAHHKLLSMNEMHPNKSYQNDPNALKEARKQCLIKFSSLEKMNALLPRELRDAQIKHYLVSSLLSNWDFLNAGFCNFGYFLTEVDGIQKTQGMSVDFGSSGTLSDQFHHNKYESYEETMNTDHHDPEMSAMILNLSFLKRDAIFSSQRPLSLTAISASPFSRQFLSTIQGLVKAEKDFYETKDFNNFEKELAPALEVAYRLLVLPDAPIEDYLRENWIMGENDFPYRDKDPQQNIDASKMTQIIKDRKKSFVQYFGKNVIQIWEGKNVLQARQARKEIEDHLDRLLHKKYVIKPLTQRGFTV